MMKCCAAKRFGQMEVQRPLGGEAPLRFRVPDIDIAGLVRKLGLRVRSVSDTSHFRENRYPEDGWYPWVFERSAQF